MVDIRCMSGFIQEILKSLQSRVKSEKEGTFAPKLQKVFCQTLCLAVSLLLVDLLRTPTEESLSLFFLSSVCLLSLSSLCLSLSLSLTPGA